MGFQQLGGMTGLEATHDSTDPILQCHSPGEHSLHDLGISKPLSELIQGHTYTLPPVTLNTF